MSNDSRKYSNINSFANISSAIGLKGSFQSCLNIVLNWLLNLIMLIHHLKKSEEGGTGLILAISRLFPMEM